MNIIKELRIKNNMKQYEVAEKIDMSKRQYIKYENEQIKPNYKFISKIAKLYNIEIKDLIIRLF